MAPLFHTLIRPAAILGEWSILSVLREGDGLLQGHGGDWAFACATHGRYPTYREAFVVLSRVRAAQEAHRLPMDIAEANLQSSRVAARTAIAGALA